MIAMDIPWTLFRNREERDQLTQWLTEGGVTGVTITEQSTYRMEEDGSWRLTPDLDSRWQIVFDDDLDAHAFLLRWG